MLCELFGTAISYLSASGWRPAAQNFAVLCRLIKQMFLCTRFLPNPSVSMAINIFMYQKQLPRCMYIQLNENSLLLYDNCKKKEDKKKFNGVCFCSPILVSLTTVYVCPLPQKILVNQSEKMNQNQLKPNVKVISLQMEVNTPQACQCPDSAEAPCEKLCQIQNKQEWVYTAGHLCTLALCQLRIVCTPLEQCKLWPVFQEVAGNPISIRIHSGCT